MTNPVWTVQAYQSTRGVTNESGKKEKPTASSALKAILKQDGVKGLWRGIGPALILVINPVIQVSASNASATSIVFLGYVAIAGSARGSAPLCASVLQLIERGPAKPKCKTRPRLRSSAWRPCGRPCGPTNTKCTS